MRNKESRNRPDPAQLLTQIEEDEQRGKRGKLKIFFGSSAGVGKTYAMLQEAQRRKAEGVDVVAGIIETHQRPETKQILEGLAQLPRLEIDHRGVKVSEFDLDAALKRKPAILLVDELAHRCVPGSRHEKRWEEIADLLDGGIDVVTSLNVQHLESLNDAVETLTGAAQRETVPDVVVASADRIDFVDITPERLRDRIAHSQVVDADMTQAALGGFFSSDHLAALREMGLRWLEDHDRLESASGPVPGSAIKSARAPGCVVVALSGAPEAERVLRRASEMAQLAHRELIGVYVRVPSENLNAEPPWLTGQQRLLSESGGRYCELAGIDVATTVLDFTRAEGGRELVLGATRRSRRDELLHGSVIIKAIRSAGLIEVHVIPARRPPERVKRPKREASTRHRRVLLPGPRRAAAWAAAVILPVAVTLGLVPVRSSLELSGVLLCNLLAVVGVALLGGFRPAMLASGVAFVASDFFCAPPFYTLRVGRLVDLVALVTFVIVAVAVGGLVDVLTRQGVHTAQANARAENFIRLAADVMVGADTPLEVIDSLRRTFDLNAASLRCRDSGVWRVEASVGKTSFDDPDAPEISAEIANGRVLTLTPSRPNGPESILLGSFVDQLRFARERALLRSIENRDHGSN